MRPMVAKRARSHVSSWVVPRIGAAGVIALCALLLGACADMPVFHEPATFVGFATNPKESADFVTATRPETTDYTSVGIEPGHPPDKPRDKDGVKKLQAELEAQRDAGHAILQKLSPEAANAEKQKSEDKSKAKEAAKKKGNDEAVAKGKSQAASEAPAEAGASH